MNFKLLLSMPIVLLAGSKVIAHHNLERIDANREMLIEGEVISWQYGSPHSTLTLDGADGIIYTLDEGAPANTISDSSY